MEEQEEDVFVDAEEELEGQVQGKGSLSQDPQLQTNAKRLRELCLGSNGENCISLSDGLEEGRRAIDCFFNNDFLGARDLMHKHCEESIYHALGFGTFNFLKAVLTYEQEYVELASKVLTKSITTIEAFRRKGGGLGDTIGLISRKKDYNEMTESEIHAELAFAECLLLKAMLTIVEDENLVSFVKAGLKVRQAYISYKECWTILNKRDWSSDKHKADFEGGVRLGVGTFNLLMSLLPARITKFMEFVGFTGSKDIGMTELLKSYRTPEGMRQFLSCLILLSYHLILTINLGKAKEADLGLVKTILDDKLSKYPNGAFFLFFKGRYEMVLGNCEEASKWYTRANNSQMSWPQFQHVGCWELLWSACIRTLWREALVQADRLLRESRWSPCLYSYFKAALYSQLGEQLTAAEREEQLCLMERVPQLKQRIAGKSLPMEKFAIKKAEKFKIQGYLMVAGLEMVYLWHGFAILCQNLSMLQRVHNIIQHTMEKVSRLNLEDECLLSLLRGMCLKYMQCPLQAEEAFRFVITRGSKITMDRYLLPFATVELAILLLDQGEVEESSQLLNTAKNYSNYCLQSRLHFRIHATQARIKQLNQPIQDEKNALSTVPEKNTSPEKNAVPVVSDDPEHEPMSPISLPNLNPVSTTHLREWSAEKGMKVEMSTSLQDFKEINPVI